ncbi:MAG: tetratricopeptide repeat protein [Candidatus Cloacimonetes bacterium]|nr:tetratricopeptide repeat protein [Candidatus Cloacimonadota bacterium]
MKKLYFLLMLIISIFLSSVQTNIDSLQTSLHKATSIDEKISILDELSHLHWTISFEKALNYAMQVSEISTTDKQKAAAHQTIGNVYSYVKDYPNALEHYQKSLKIDRKIKNKKGIAKSYINIGVIYLNLSDYDTSLDYFLKAIKIVETNGDKISYAAVLKNIGSVYWYLKNYNKALEYFINAKEIEQELNDLEGVAGSLSNIGTIYWFTNDNNKALNYFNEALAVSRQIGDKIIIAGTLNNIGELHFGKNDFSQAMNYYEQSLKIKNEINDKNGLANTLLNIGNLHLEKKELDKAQEKYLTGLKIAQEIKSKTLCEQYYSHLSQLYSARQNYEEALKLFQQYTEIRDSIYSDEVTRRIAELDIKYDSEKKEKELELLRKDQQITTLKIKRQRINWLFSLLAIILLIIMASILYNRYKLKMKINLQLHAEINERKKMQEDLKNMKDNLEILVQERTKELIATNKKLEHEIQEREKIQEVIKQSLIEKEILLKEIHHRVKNNMQIILSLLKLQAENIKDHSLLQIFQSSQNRIMAMSLVHEKLYMSSNFAEISLYDYFYSLVRYLVIQYSAQNVCYEIETNNISLTANAAIPIGLIFNEIISNSLKHALSEVEKGVIQISFQQKAGNYILTIRDNGKGFSMEELTVDKTNLGIELIHSLVTQLEGTIKLEKNNGTVYVIEFPIKD